VTVAGRSVETWDQFPMAVGTKPNREVSSPLVRNGAGQTRTLTPTLLPVKAASSGRHRRCCRTAPVAAQVTAGEPGDQAGLKVGD